jgi:hypothetical protein
LIKSSVVPKDDPEPAHADRPRRLDELLLALGHHLAREPEHHDDGDEARSQRGHEREREQDQRERQHDVDDHAAQPETGKSRHCTAKSSMSMMPIQNTGID